MKARHLKNHFRIKIMGKYIKKIWGWIQIIRATQGGKGGSTKCHRDYLLFSNTPSNGFLKLKVWKLDKALKYNVCILHFSVKSILTRHKNDRL
jgi:hypothetical protein